MPFISLRSKSGRFSFVLTSWSNSDVRIDFPPHLEAVLMLGLYFPLTSWSNSDVGIVYFPHILKQFWILVLGVFCCAPGPVVFRCNSLLSCYLSFWEASLGGFIWFSHLEAILMFGVFCCAPGPVVSEVIVFVVLAFISPLMSNSGRLLFVHTSWSNSNVSSIFPPYLEAVLMLGLYFFLHLEAILMLGVFCCASGPVGLWCCYLCRMFIFFDSVSPAVAVLPVGVWRFSLFLTL